MSSEVFVIASARAAEPAAAIQQALELAGVEPERVEDAILGATSSLFPDVTPLLRAAALRCHAAFVTPGLRRLSVAAASVLSDDTGLIVFVGMEADASVAILLASPDVVGALNLMPRARIAARTLKGDEAALQQAGMTASDVEVSRRGESVLLLDDVLGELDVRAARWAMLTSPHISMLIERI